MTILSTSNAASNVFVILIMVQPGLYWVINSAILHLLMKGFVSATMMILERFKIVLTIAIFFERSSLD